MRKHNYRITFTTGFELTLLCNQYDRKLLVKHFGVRAFKRLQDDTEKRIEKGSVRYEH